MATMNNKEDRITIRVHSEISEYLERLEHGSGKTKSTLIREMILEYMIKNRITE